MTATISASPRRTGVVSRLPVALLQTTQHRGKSHSGNPSARYWACENIVFMVSAGSRPAQIPDSLRTATDSLNNFYVIDFYI
jgi:hypothetical protein